jgi:hypothetical protein
MTVCCPRCGTTIPSEDVNIARLVAKCRPCGAVFNFESQLGLPRSPANRPVARVMLPPGIDLAVSEQQAPPAMSPYRGGVAEAGELLLTRKWFDAQAIMLLIFGVVWSSFLLFWYRMAFSTGAPWIFFVFPLAHVAAGVVIVYRALTGLFNKTTIRVSNGKLSVRHGPIPAFGNRDIDVSDLRQLYTVTKARSKGGTTYEVHALAAVGPTVKLVSGLRDMQQAVYIERTLEDHLRIEDDPTANQLT